MNKFLPEFDVFLAILTPNYRIDAIILRFKISHLAVERVLLILTQFHPNPIISNEQLII